MLALRPERRCAENPRAPHREQRRRVALPAGLELIQRLAQLWGDVDSRDLTVDDEVALPLDARVLLSNRGRDQVTELVKA